MAYLSIEEARRKPLRPPQPAALSPFPDARRLIAQPYESRITDGRFYGIGGLGQTMEEGREALVNSVKRFRGSAAADALKNFSGEELDGVVRAAFKSPNWRETISERAQATGSGSIIHEAMARATAGSILEPIQELMCLLNGVIFAPWPFGDVVRLALKNSFADPASVVAKLRVVETLLRSAAVRNKNSVWRDASYIEKFTSLADDVSNTTKKLTPIMEKMAKTPVTEADVKARLDSREGVTQGWGLDRLKQDAETLGLTAAPPVVPFYGSLGGGGSYVIAVADIASKLVEYKAKYAGALKPADAAEFNAGVCNFFAARVKPVKPVAMAPVQSIRVTPPMYPSGMMTPIIARGIRVAPAVPPSAVMPAVRVSTTVANALKEAQALAVKVETDRPGVLDAVASAFELIDNNRCEEGLAALSKALSKLEVLTADVDRISQLVYEVAPGRVPTGTGPIISLVIFADTKAVAEAKKKFEGFEAGKPASQLYVLAVSYTKLKGLSAVLGTLSRMTRKWAFGCAASQADHLIQSVDKSMNNLGRALGRVDADIRKSPTATTEQIKNINLRHAQLTDWRTVDAWKQTKVRTGGHYTTFQEMRAKISSWKFGELLNILASKMQAQDVCLREICLGVSKYGFWDWLGMTFPGASLPPASTPIGRGPIYVVPTPPPPKSPVVKTNLYVYDPVTDLLYLKQGWSRQQAVPVKHGRDTHMLYKGVYKGERFSDGSSVSLMNAWDVSGAARCR